MSMKNFKKYQYTFCRTFIKKRILITYWESQINKKILSQICYVVFTQKRSTITLMLIINNKFFQHNKLK